MICLGGEAHVGDTDSRVNEKGKKTDDEVDDDGDYSVVEEEIKRNR